MPELDGRIAIVTGATGGLGPAVVDALLASGATVVGVSRRPPEPAGTRLTGWAADLTDGDAAREMATGVMQRYGRIDILAHVAGGFAGGAPVAETADDTWNRMFDLNTRAAFNTLRAVIPHMRAAAYGRVVAVASRAAVEPGANIAAYSASKAALVALVRSAALENADRGTTVNAVMPGTIDTAANREAAPDARRAGWVPPRDIAALILWLVSEGAGSVSGAAIPVYGMQP